MTKYYFDRDGKCLGGFDGVQVGEEYLEPEPPEGQVGFTYAPPKAGWNIWDGKQWLDGEPPLIEKSRIEVIEEKISALEQKGK